ncbi:MAG: hypothetical protein KGI33_10080, partial [Thaumarchaeota archaeon]|nr:hypothetical protein [Nitrososphaerota archaeon]
EEQCMGGRECPGGIPPSPPASIGNRRLELTLKIYPNSTMPNVHYIWFRFFDANTNQTLHHITFFLHITNQSQLLFYELFHTHTGILEIRFISTSGTKWYVTGDREPILGGWMPYKDDEPVTVHAPMFNDTKATYHFNVQIRTIDQDNNLFNITDAPVFDFYLNMKEQNQTITTPNITVPEFPFVIPVLLMGITIAAIFKRNLS